MSDVKFTSYKTKVLQDINDGIDRALEICGGTAERYAKEICPVRTGRLRGSIGHAKKNPTTEQVGTDVEYAPYVELGTRYQKAQPYLRPAVENHRGEYERIIRSELNR